MDRSGPTSVFGGTGFLGSRIVTRLLQAGHRVRVASRHPDRARELFGDPVGDPEHAIEPVQADVHDDDLIRRAVDGARNVVNAVSLYVERHGQTFHSVHVEAAARVAARAREAGVERLVHVSGIGSDPSASSPYIRSRGEGERAVRDAFPGAIVVRPAVMFGAGDAFVAPVADLLRKLPAFAMFGYGCTRLQPAWVEDVAEGVVRALQAPDRQPVYEFAGPEILTYADLLRLVRRHLGIRTPLFPMPFGAWLAAAAAAERLPSPPITRNQVQLMQADNVADPDQPGLDALGIAPGWLTDKLPEILASR